MSSVVFAEAVARDPDGAEWVLRQEWDKYDGHRVLKTDDRGRVRGLRRGGSEAQTAKLYRASVARWRRDGWSVLSERVTEFASPQPPRARRKAKADPGRSQSGRVRARAHGRAAAGSTMAEIAASPVLAVSAVRGRAHDADRLDGLRVAEMPSEYTAAEIADLCAEEGFSLDVTLRDFPGRRFRIDPDWTARGLAPAKRKSSAPRRPR